MHSLVNLAKTDKHMVTGIAPCAGLYSLIHLVIHLVNASKILWGREAVFALINTVHDRYKALKINLLLCCEMGFLFEIICSVACLF